MLKKKNADKNAYIGFVYLIRKRKIIDLKFGKFNKKELDLVVECTAGTYVKEFINGDNQRTKPSIAEILDNKVNKIVLDVIKIKDKQPLKS